MRVQKFLGRLGALIYLLALASCGGGGSGGGSAGGGGSSGLAPSSSLAGICTLDGQKQWVRSNLNEDYLWYRQIPAVNAASYSTVQDYFHALLVTTPDANGLPTDQFSFVLSSTDADSLSNGINVGFGVQWAYDAVGRVRVALVDANSPASDAGIQRGGQLIAVQSGNVNTWYPNSSGAWRQFMYSDTPGQAARSVTLYARSVLDDPVPQVSVVTSPQGQRTGYVQFNDHSQGAQDKLITALAWLQGQSVGNLVLDMRYNSGGYLYVAEALASMLTGPRADGQVFEKLRYNDKRPNDTAQGTFLFANAVQYAENNYQQGYAWPRLNLSKVYVLTGDYTCSASESVINSLRGVDVQVILVGTRTCGKPYGFSRRDNCSLAYFPIEFQGTNAKGFGDYSAGFAPTCASSDDLDQALGAPQEGQLAAALYHLDHGSCNPASSQSMPAQLRAQRDPVSAWMAGLPRPVHGRLLQTPTH